MKVAMTGVTGFGNALQNNGGNSIQNNGGNVLQNNGGISLQNNGGASSFVGSKLSLTTGGGVGTGGPQADGRLGFQFGRGRHHHHGRHGHHGTGGPMCDRSRMAVGGGVGGGIVLQGNGSFSPQSMLSTGSQSDALQNNGGNALQNNGGNVLQNNGGDALQNNGGIAFQNN